MSIKKCALYIRVSTQRQASVEDGSLKAQEARLKAYVDYENINKGGKWEIVDIYREEGRSAKDLKRPEFQRLMADIEKGKINTIIIWKIDRLTRSLKDFSTLWEIFKEKGVQIISLNEKFDTSTAIGRAMINIILVFAQLEREQTGERTSATMQYRAEQGLWNGGRVIGYDLDPQNKGVLKINRQQIAIVKKAFDLCIEKGSAGQVQKALNELGYRMPVYKSRRGKEHGNTLFTKQAVIRMLTNPVYIGKISWGGKLYQGRHQAAIDEKKFFKVQEILRQNRKKKTNNKLPRKHVYLLQGILRCGKCGSMMSPKSGINGSGKPYHYYQCTRNSHIGNVACKAKYVPAKPIEDFVVDRIKELTTNQEEIEKMVKNANKHSSAKLKKLIQDKQNLQKALRQVKEKLNTMVDTIETNGVKAFKTLQERMVTLEKQRQDLEKKLEAIDFEVTKIEQEKVSAEIMQHHFKSFRDIIKKANPQRLKELLFQIVEFVEWHQNPDDASSGHCKISYFEQPRLTFPKNKESEQGVNQLFAQSINWLPGQGSNLRPAG